MSVPVEPPGAKSASPRPRQHPRCPRCGAGMGRLAADGVDPAPGDSAEHYCGCCGLVVAVPPPGS